MNTDTNSSDSTANQLLTTALRLFMTHGLKKVTMEEVAREAGVTRVTVYRYYADKQSLVQAVFLHIASFFEAARDAVEQTSDIETIVNLIGRALASVPPGDFPTRLDELRRLYPGIYARFRDVRLNALEALFNQLFALAKSQGRLRPGLNSQVVQTYFMESVATVIESPRLIALGLSPDDIFQTVKAVFLYGILTEG